VAVLKTPETPWTAKDSAGCWRAFEIAADAGRRKDKVHTGLLSKTNSVMEVASFGVDPSSPRTKFPTCAGYLRSSFPKPEGYIFLLLGMPVSCIRSRSSIWESTLWSCRLPSLRRTRQSPYRSPTCASVCTRDRTLSMSGVGWRFKRREQGTRCRLLVSI
jgi:hypothetical protein